MSEKYQFKLVSQISQIILQHRGEARHYNCKSQVCPQCSNKLSIKINKFVANNQPIKFVLPAFPAKSANRQKTFNHLPDYGEKLGLMNLNNLMHKINSIYKPGAKIIICSDGRVFNDIVGVKVHEVTQYQTALINLTKRLKLENIAFFSLDDQWSHLSFEQMRKNLESYHAESIDKIKQDVTTNTEEKHLFNGLHRFIYEDLLNIKQDLLSKNKIKKLAKSISYKVIQRSHAWSNLVSKIFPDCIRFSIHPHQCGSDKLAFQLIPNSNQWATPWHNVIIKDDNDDIILIKNKYAKQLNTEIIFENDQPSYYKLLDKNISDITRMC